MTRSLDQARKRSLRVPSTPPMASWATYSGPIAGSRWALRRGRAVAPAGAGDEADEAALVGDAAADLGDEARALGIEGELDALGATLGARLDLALSVDEPGRIEGDDRVAAGTRADGHGDGVLVERDRRDRR